MRYLILASVLLSSCGLERKTLPLRVHLKPIPYTVNCQMTLTDYWANVGVSYKQSENNGVVNSTAQVKGLINTLDVISANGSSAASEVDVQVDFYNLFQVNYDNNLTVNVVSKNGHGGSFKSNSCEGY